MEKLLVINAGSSTIKWKIFTLSNVDVVAEGVADRIGIDGVLTLKFNNNKKEMKQNLPDHTEAMDAIVKILQEEKIIEQLDEVKVIGHRVVHGGEHFTKSAMINDDAIAKIDELSTLAPLHNPNALKVIKSCLKIWPQAVASAIFDTSFHSTIPPLNNFYPINYQLAKDLKIKKYGFHGTSHRFITNQLQKILNKDQVTFISAHIGNGASLCAVKENKSFDTTMGLTPLAGIMMGTRSGDIDPSIHKFIADNKKMSLDEITNMLNKESGLKGVSGLSPDLRDIEIAMEKGNEQVQFAFDLYVQKIVDYLANFANKLDNNLDAIVFTAGCGENSVMLRDEIVKKLKFDKIKLNKDLNESKIDDYLLISSEDSKVKVFVIRTDEELLIALDAKNFYIGKEE